MSDMPANNLKELVASYSRRERVRSPQEITARYNQDLMAYKELCFSGQDVSEQKLRVYNEIKVLGWVLGKPEKTVIKDIGEHSNKMFIGVKLD